DFQTGDWIGYRETWVPSNNFYGSTLIAMDELDKRKFAARTAAQNEAVAGAGFLSRKVCDADGCEIKTPGTFVEESVNEALLRIPGSNLVNSVIGVDGLQGYMTAIVNAALNQLVQKGIEGLRSTKDVPATSASGFTQPSSFELGLGTINDTLENSQFENDRLYILTQIDNAIVPYQSAGDVIRRSLEKQSTIVSYADLCTDAQLTTIGINKAFEENTLTLLEEEIVDLQTFIDELNRARSAVNGVEAGNNAELSLTVNAIQPLLGADGNAVLQNAIEENEAINEDYNTKVPDLTINCLAF
ncbi:MAG: hypothetical protein Q8R26_01450, partial [bacterium]|nr:hypothetical protein [bacterium]